MARSAGTMARWGNRGKCWAGRRQRDGCDILLLFVDVDLGELRRWDERWMWGDWRVKK